MGDFTMFSRLAPAVLSILVLPVAASAATYVVTGVVTESSATPAGPGAPVLNYPAVGSAGTLTYTIDGADDAPLMDAPGGFPSGDNFGFSAWLDVGGWSAGFLNSPVTNVESYYSGTDLFRISGTDITADGETGTFAGSLRFTFAAPLATAPATYGDLRATIGSGALASFSFNGDSFGGGNWVSFAFQQVAPAPVPLPATGLMLMGGVMTLIAARRRR